MNQETIYSVGHFLNIYAKHKYIFYAYKRMHINIQKMIWKNKWQNDDLWEDGRVGSKGPSICNALKKTIFVFLL